MRTLIFTAFLPLVSPWSYSGFQGPQYWHTLNQGFAACAPARPTPGQRHLQQSPIDIPHLPIRHNAPQYSVNAQHGVAVHRQAHHVEVSAKGSVQWQGITYHIVNIHVNAPAEHRLHHLEADLGVHVVAKSVTGQVLVTGILFRATDQPSRLGPASRFVREFAQGVKNHAPIPTLNVPALLQRLTNPVTSKFYTYSGSLTTPPCTPGVTWIVQAQMEGADIGDLDRIRDFVGFSARPVQPWLGGGGSEDDLAQRVGEMGWP